MQKIRVVLLLCALMKIAPGVEATEKQARTGPTNRVKMPELSQFSETHLTATAESLTIILKQKLPEPVRAVTHLNRAKTYLSLAQKKLLNGKQSGPQTAVRHILDLAIEDAKAVTSSASATMEQRSEGHYLSGTAHLYAARDAESVSDFEHFLRIHPASKNANWVAFVLAEQYFDLGRAREALELYQRYHEKFDENLKPIALYKTAWCWVNLGQYSEADTLFHKVIATYPTNDIAKDSLRDLAFVATKVRSEQDILKIAQKLAQQEGWELEFLRSAQAQYETRGTTTLTSMILTRLLELEKKPVRKVQLYLGVLNGVRKDYASLEHFNTFMAIQNALKKEKIDPNSKDFDVIRSVLEQETLRVIRNFSETFFGKKENKEKIEQTRLGSTLKILFAFHNEFLSQAPSRTAVFTLWLETCAALKDWKCVNDTAEKVEADPVLKPIQPAAEVDRLVALEELSKAGDASIRAEFKKKLEIFIRDRESSSQWVGLAKRLVDLRLDQKEANQAVILAEKIFAKEKSPENFYKLQWIRFQLGRDTDLIEDNRAGQIGGAPHPKLEDLLRESALRAAQKERANGNVKGYSRYLQVFLDHNRDSKKGRLAKKDEIQFLLEKSNPSGAIQAFLALNPVDRNSAEFSDLLVRLGSYQLGRADFKGVLALLPRPPSLPVTENLIYIRTLAQIGLGIPISIDALPKLSTQNRRHLLGLLSFLQPNSAIAFLKNHSPKDENENSILLLALRISKENWDFLPTPDEARWIGGALPLGMQNFSATPTERAIQNLKYPPAKTHGNKFNQMVQSLVEATRAFRGKFTADLAGKPQKIQSRILGALRANELKVAEQIRSSPTPNGLTQQQLLEYRQGVEELAKEFSDHALEYEKLIQAASQAVQREVAKNKELYLPPPTMEKWPWPEDLDKTQEFWIILREQIRQKNAAGVLIIADLYRKNILKSDDSYYSIRAGALLMSSKSAVVRRYVLEELTQFKQTLTIERWKEYAK